MREFDAEPEHKQRRGRDCVGDDAAARAQDVQREQDGDEDDIISLSRRIWDCQSAKWDVIATPVATTTARAAMLPMPERNQLFEAGSRIADLTAGRL